MAQNNLWIGLVHNASWLLSLFVIYEFTSYVKSKNQQVSQIIYGVLIGAICVAVMALPFSLFNGIVFDTRSILISITALLFGWIPATITAGIAIVYRSIMGGAGTIAGIATIISSAAIGLLWRKWMYPKKQGVRWLSVYVMSMIVHIAMLLDMLLLPDPYRFLVIGAIFYPVILIYPIASVLLCMLLNYQQERRQYQETIKKKEEEYRRITENISDVVWLTDMHLKTTYVSQSVERVLGESPAVHMTRSIEEKFPPEALNEIKALYEQELQNENQPNCDKYRTRTIELEHFKADGSLVWLSIHMSLIWDENGKKIGIQGIARDISDRKASEFALEAERNKAQLYIDISPIIFVALDLELNVVLINQEGCKQLENTKEFIIGKQWTKAFVPEKDRIKIEETFDTMLAESSDRIVDLENAILTEQKNERNVFWRIAALKDSNGKLNGLLLSGIDITEKTIALNELRESERSKAVLLENLPGMKYRCNYDRLWTMQYVSNGCQELTGYTTESLLNNRDLTFNDVIAPEYQENVWEKWNEVLNSHKKFKEEYEIITASGDRKWVWEHGQGIFDETGSVVALEGIILDITERKKYENELKFIAEHNPLTGLLNLRSFNELFLNMRNRKTTSNSAIIIINVRRFSYLNRIFGYTFCDQLIEDIANCLRLISLERLKLFHLSVDRFLFYITEYENQQDLIDLCEQIIIVLETGISLKTVCFNLGILEIDYKETIDSERILKRAEIASEYRNEHKRFNYFFFNKEIEAKQLRELAISNSLNETMNNESDSSLFMLYQPIVNATSNQIVGFEALARYQTKELGLVSPLEFIPIAESTQMILLLGEKIMRLVFGFALCLEQKGFQDVSVSFNISAIQLLSESFLSDLENLIKETRVNARNLNIELTESVFADNYLEINEKLERLKELGIKIAIDDFGTGYSSLARERELNVDTVKIDRYFIHDLTKVLPENAIIGDIISMAHKMGHAVIAEGVELEEQRQYLVEHNCDLIQGYLFGKPLEEKDAISMLIQNTQ